MLTLYILNFLISQCSTCSTCYMIFLNFTNFVTFISFLSFLFQEVFFIMLKHHFNHFFLTQFILVKDVQMLFSCNCCTRQEKLCVISDKFNKYSEYVYLKKIVLIIF